MRQPFLILIHPLQDVTEEEYLEKQQTMMETVVK